MPECMFRGEHVFGWSTLLCAALLTVAPVAVMAQSQPDPAAALVTDGSARILWQRVFASDHDDWINDIVPMKDGSFMAVGFLDRQGAAGDSRALAALVQDDGKVLAQREYGAGGGFDAFWSMAQAADGKLAFAGFTSRMGGGGFDGWSMVTDSAGKIVKENAFGGGAGYDRFIDLAPTADGGYLFVGHTQPPGTPDVRYLFVVKTNADGIEQWRRAATGPTSDPALYIEPSGDGGFIIAGGLEDDVLVLKIDAQGKELWRRTIGTPGVVDNDHGLVVLPDGRIVIVGYTASWGAGSNDILRATLSPSGDIQKVETFGGVEDDRAILARADAQGRVWIVGYTKSAGAGGWDLFVTRLNASGSFEGGLTTLGTAKDDNGTAIRPLADGSLLVAGYSRGLGPGGEDAFLARLSAPDWKRPHPSFTRRSVSLTR